MLAGAIDRTGELPAHLDDMRFDMRTWSLGPCSYMVGLTRGEALSADVDLFPLRDLGIDDVLSRFGLSIELAEHLAAPWAPLGPDFDWVKEATRQQCARVIRHLAEHQEIDWRRVRYGMPSPEDTPERDPLG